MFLSFALKQTLVRYTSFLYYLDFNFNEPQHVLNSPEQNVQIFSRIWYMIYAFIIVKGMPSPDQDQEKNFHLTCQKLAVEKKRNMKIGYKSTENLRSKIHEEKSRMDNGIREVMIGKVDNLHLYEPLCVLLKKGRGTLKFPSRAVVYPRSWVLITIYRWKSSK